MTSKYTRAALPHFGLRSAAIAAITVAAAMTAAPSAMGAVEYVKVCTLYGAGFFYIPGTDQCGISSGMPYRQQTAYGTIRNTVGTGATAYGVHSFAYGAQSLAIGDSAWAGGDPTSASPGVLGGAAALNGMAPGTAFFNAGTTAIGDGARAGAGAVGQTNATAVGQNATANAASASAIGQASNAAGNFSTAFGASSNAVGSYSIAEGVFSNASSTGAAAFGSKSNASGKYAVAVGQSANATQTGSIAVGHNASSTGENAIAIGTNASATGSVAVGNNSAASNGGAAFGDFASATGSKSTAIGYGASATGANSVAVGAGSVASGANTFSVGSPGSPRRITNIAPGTGPNDAVNLVQYNTGITNTLNQAKAYSDSGFAQALSQAEGYTDQQLGTAGIGTSDLRRKAFSGIAAAVAMGDGGMPSAPGNTRFSMHTSQFENYTGVGASLSHRFDTETPFAVDAGYAHAANEDVGRVGFSVEF